MTFFRPIKFDKLYYRLVTDQLVVQVEQSAGHVYVCLSVQTITFELMTFDLDIWHVGSP